MWHVESTQSPSVWTPTNRQTGTSFFIRRRVIRFYRKKLIMRNNRNCSDIDMNDFYSQKSLKRENLSKSMACGAATGEICYYGNRHVVTN